MNNLGKLSIGAVSYLNSKPLIYGLPRNVRLLEPSALAAEYERGVFDLALIPVVAALQNPGARLLDVGIAADGEVYSVILTLPKPLPLIRTVSLDSSSRTSVNLVKIILERHCQRRVEYVPHGAPADAQVLIGTKAIDFRAANRGVPVLDLAAAWKAHTGLPFVFAAWTMHPRASLSADMLAQFRVATLSGLAHRQRIARDDFELRYLTRYIRYELTADHQAAIARLSAELRALSLLSSARLPAFV
ncbi:MAG: menaquinone biosynthesis protein [Verrucomicrobiales bacterium]|jgi:predicted solute-binding protein|nr:menaquinone biosynthesis protein [Verrucomicrobiales bacterium]